MPVTQMFFASFYFWMIVLLSAPVITMRLFALEKASGTFETLMTAPVGDLEVVAAKFAAAFVVLRRHVAAVAGLPVPRRPFHQPGWRAGLGHGGRHVPGHFPGGRFFPFLRLPGFGAVAQPDGGGHDFARLRRQPVCAGVVGQNIRSPTTGSRSCGPCLNLFDRMTDLARGAVDTRALIFYLSTTFLFLFLTLRVVESRRWK